jgi:sialidase-1
MALHSRRRFGAAVLSSLAIHAQPRSPRALGPIREIPTAARTYSGWPTLARRASGELVLAWSGDREAHVCPFGRVLYAVSRDGGESWSWPRVILDSDLDDRDAGILETPRKTLLVTTFTSLAYQAVLERARQSGFAGWDSGKAARWDAVERRLSADTRQSRLGCWMLRSTDDGLTWSPPYRVPLNSPHGPIAVSGGRLLYAGKDLWGGGQVGVCESTDDGLTWRWLSRIVPRPGDTVDQYHELHMVEATPGGRLVLHIRNHNEANRGETLQTESDNGGAAWTEPHPIGVWGLPSHLLRLRGGRLLMTYGYRRAPFGNHARLSSDEGRTWSDPFTLSADGASGDLGYPSTVQLSGGQLLTVWYETRPESPFAVLRQVRWELDGRGASNTSTRRVR